MNELVIPRASVGKLGDELGRGGQARVYLAPGLPLPDAPGPLVYKEYKESSRPPAGGLRALVDKRNRLDPATRGKLDACACWPLRVVEDRGVVMGVMLRLIPPDFIQERILQHTKVRKQSVREIQHLIVEPAMTRRFGMQCPTPAQRLVICRDFAAAVHRVHRMDLVIGDINARNALYRVPDRPSVMLLDCDAVRIVGSAAVVRSSMRRTGTRRKVRLPSTSPRTGTSSASSCCGVWVPASWRRSTVSRPGRRPCWMPRGWRC